ncbi:hypothetical protein [uncultured Draconibacterium sp.]|uniref:hypothetical protein n=1 Tax=uncultured Draconibacterium sp. TaxID=1573823 RepID=UPI0025EFE843|nr:hypothetical protein [uncultured Draconibacterium sp.]
MGYNGLGMQRWISTMKPRKYLGKRSKPDGGGGEPSSGPGVSSYYHIKKREFSILKSKTYTERYKQKLQSELLEERKSGYRTIVLSIITGLLIVVLLFVYFNPKLNWF